jgi:UDP-GlcNAc:undecaprenyl-phosphate/decaprenyl-phosphate GlcNAc-1-phosphate transferase
MHTMILGFTTALLVTFLAIPAIILVALKRNLFDKPNNRSSHERPTPNLGGIGIFGGVFTAIILWTPTDQFGQIQYLLAAFVLIFLIGLRDDLLPLTPKKKFLIQFLAAAILVLKADVSVTSIWGILWVYELPYWVSVTLSVLAIVGVVNAFNLIDGINGLAASLALVASITFGAWFFLTNHMAWAVLAFALAGALIAFLKFNITPARIFMGDTGSLFIGMVCIVLAIKFSELNLLLPAGSVWHCASAPVVALSALLLPIYDTLRVFLRRMSQGKSPFHADKTHIHHMMLDCGFSHMQATAILVMLSMVCVIITVLLRDLGPNWLLLILLITMISFNFVLARQASKRSAAARSTT